MKKVLAILMLAMMFTSNAFAMGFWQTGFQKCNKKVYDTCKGLSEGSPAYTQCVADETNKCSCTHLKRPHGIHQGGTYTPFNDSNGNPYSCN